MYAKRWNLSYLRGIKWAIKKLQAQFFQIMMRRLGEEQCSIAIAPKYASKMYFK